MPCLGGLMNSLPLTGNELSRTVVPLSESKAAPTLVQMSLPPLGLVTMVNTSLIGCSPFPAKGLNVYAIWSYHLLSLVKASVVLDMASWWDALYLFRAWKTPHGVFASIFQCNL